MEDEGQVLIGPIESDENNGQGSTNSNPITTITDWMVMTVFAKRHHVIYPVFYALDARDEKIRATEDD